MPALRDLIIERLRTAGVRAIFGVPGGGGNLDLIEGAGHAGLPFVLTATETAGALAAMAQAEVTGSPGACLTTLGPGAASVVNGVACAFLDRAPIVVFTDSHSTTAAGAYEHQQIDQQALFRPITKWTGRIGDPGDVAAIECAFAALAQDPPGPVHIECPDESLACGGPPGGTKVPPLRVPPGGSEDPPLRVDSRRPIVIAGLGARRPEDAAAIRAFIERHDIPALVTYKAKGVIPDDHRCFAGVFTNARIEQDIAGASDLIIGIGLDPVELLPRPWPFRAPAVYVGRWRVVDRQIPFAAQHVGSIGDVLAMLGALSGRAEWDLDDIRGRVIAQRQSIDIRARGMTAQHVVRATASRLAADSRVTVDAGAHMFPATMLWPVREPNQMLISNGLSTMGFALPAAIGAALADRERRVVALTGDGGLLMCAGELLTAVREKLRISVIVFNDASLSLIEIKQQRRQLRAAGVALGSTDWVRLAESFGAAGFAAANERELDIALDQATKCDGPSVIDARIDGSNYAATLAAIRG